MSRSESNPVPAGSSLAGRLGSAALARLGRLRATLTTRREAVLPGGREWQVAAAVATLLALGPVATIVGATIIGNGVRAETARLDTRTAPLVAARKTAERDRTELAAILRRPGLGSLIEAIARALPSEAALLRVERARDGLLEIDVRTPDPDKLRVALRREPILAALRDSGQRQSDASMIVSFRERAQ